MYDKAIDKFPFVLDSVPDQYKIQEMRDKILSDDPIKFKIL